MKRLRTLTAAMAAVLALSGAVCADDGAINNKSMSKTITVPVFESAEVNAQVPEAEHAFAGMMGFYVPAQASNGLLDPIEYCDIDNQPESGEDCTSPVETLAVAKPLVNVFIYGPALEVAHTAFAHSFMDTYGAVSLDDGQTFKKTNLSESATLSSFDLELDHLPSAKDHMPADHNVLLGSINNGAYHAPGYTYPFTSHCSECHGPALQGTAKAPSCYSCHDSNKWDEATPADLGPVIKEAIWKNDKLAGVGENAPSKAQVTYPGGTYNVFMASAGNKVLVAWPSRFCSSGSPGYSYAWDGDDEGLTEEQLAKRTAVATLLGIDVTKDLYLTDLFGVGGSQGSIDFADEGYPQAGIVPFGCVWTARGILLPGDDPRTD
jgi:hypothetical protein